MIAQGYRATALVAAGVVLASGCGDDTELAGPGDGPPTDERETSELTFLHPAPDAPPLLLGDEDADGAPDTSFVATRGRDTTVEIHYEDDDEPGAEGDRFLRFELDDETLLRYPDDHPMAGAEFSPGDTVTITIEIASDTLLADLGPDGLRFDPDDPAELEMRWIRADGDTDDDGEEDIDENEEEIDVWRQEGQDDPWIRSGEIRDVDEDRIRAFIESFTRYAMAI